METYNEEFLEIIKPIANHPEYIKRKQFKHHEGLSVYEHSLQVAYKAYLMAKKYKLDYKSAVIGAMLHDFYYKPWQDSLEKKPFFEQHGFVHAKEALDNSKKYFPQLMNKKIEDIILKHMFPLNIKKPKYKETWVVTISDKLCSLKVLKHIKEYPKYLGLKRNNK